MFRSSLFRAEGLTPADDLSLKLLPYVVLTISLSLYICFCHGG